MADRYIPSKDDKVKLKYDVFVYEKDGRPVYAETGHTGTVCFSYDNGQASVCMKLSDGAMRTVRLPFDALYKMHITRPFEGIGITSMQMLSNTLATYVSSKESPVITVTYDENKSTFTANAGPCKWATASGDPTYRSIFDYAEHYLSNTDFKNWVKNLNPKPLMERFKNHEIDILVPRDNFETFLAICHANGIKWQSGIATTEWDRFYKLSAKEERCYFRYGEFGLIWHEGDRPIKPSREVITYKDLCDSL